MAEQRTLVVGAGITGATIARTIADRTGTQVVVAEECDEVSGNLRDPVDNETGIRFHAHGPHAFHTNSEKVFYFLSRFTTWTRYEHKVLANVNGSLIPSVSSSLCKWHLA